MRLVRVKAYSAAYFAVLEKIDELREPLALLSSNGTTGVVVAGRSVAIAGAADGVETLIARDLSSVEASW